MFLIKNVLIIFDDKKKKKKKKQERTETNSPRLGR